MNSINFVVHPLSSSDEQFNDKIKELSDKLNKHDLQTSPPLNKLSISKVAICQSYMAFLLQDGSICRVSYSVCADQLLHTKSDNNKSSKDSNTKAESRTISNNNRGIRIAENPLILIRGDESSSINEQAVSSLRTSRVPGTRPRGRLVRAVGRGHRGSGVIVGSRPIIPASVVPEEYINRCQSVLQGKSRALIIRELQRTNLDVNLAVNNLLTRDIEGEDDADNCNPYMSDDLMSLLDAGIHSEHPSVIIDSDAMFSEEVFGYSTMRARNSSRSRGDRDGDGLFHVRSRWLDEARVDKSDGLSVLQQEYSSNNKYINPFSFGEELVYWKDKKGDLMHFTDIGSMHSDLVAINCNGVLCQWKWNESEPYYCPENPMLMHSKAALLNLQGEVVCMLSCCDTRASVLTESGKVATWTDDSLSLVSHKMDQPSTSFYEFTNDKILSLHTCNLYTCARTESGLLYWWGIMAYGQRKRSIEKMRSKGSKSRRGENKNNNNDFIVGSQVCLHSSPIYNIGAQGFGVFNGVPKTGSLLKAAWTLDETCRFKITQAPGLHEIKLPPDQRGSTSDTYKPDMPPPPSPASSTCSDQSGPSLVTFSRKRKQQTSWSSDVKDEEEWCLKDVVFVEDSKPIPVGKVLKVDGSYVLVKFPPVAATPPASSNEAAVTGVNKDDVLTESRILRKDDLQLVKGSVTPKVPDFIQKTPKRVMWLEASTAGYQSYKIITVTIDPSNIHMIVSNGNRLLYKHFSMAQNKLLNTYSFPTDSLSFLANNPSVPTFHNCQHTSSPLLLRDGNGALYPMLKDCLSGVRDPLWFDMAPLSSVTMYHHVIPSSSSSSSSSKNSLAIVAMVSQTQTLIPALLKSDLTAVRNVLQNIESKENAHEREKLIEALLLERCDGNRNIIHACVTMCAPVSNKESDCDMQQSYPSSELEQSDVLYASFQALRRESSIRDPYHLATSRGLRAMVSASAPNSSSRLDEKDDRFAYNWTASDEATASNCSFPTRSSSSNNTANNNSTNLPSFLIGQTHKPIRSEEKDSRNSSLCILKLLCESPLLQVHLLELLKAKSTEGLTPFMQSLCSRAYPAGAFLFDTCKRISTKDGWVDKDILMSMLYPPNSSLDNSPIHLLSCNDMCSFTWTGDEHINQDIFECRTCGLVGSLCCCTECARTCHKGHDCKLKKTSPTAYCDCWEKCKCRALVAGNQAARLSLLNQLLINTDLVKLPNSRGENILMFLLQTVGRQIAEQRQFRPSKVRANLSCPRKIIPAEIEPQMPEHNLEPPKFSRKALERILNDWTAVKSMLLTGVKEAPHGTCLYEDQAYTSSQSGVSMVDKFVHCLIVKCTNEMLEILLETLKRESHCNTDPQRRADAVLVSRRFIRSVARIFVVISVEMVPQNNKKKGSTCNSTSPLNRCRRVFHSLINMAIEELTGIAESLVSPVMMGVARPTAAFSLVTSSSDAIQGSEELFSIEAVSVQPASSDTATAPASFSGPADVAAEAPAAVVADERREGNNVEEEIAPVDNEMEGLDEVIDHHSDHSEHYNTVESDMELDMMNASDSDSDESTRSHADNASVQRSAITAATAGSDAGVGSLPYFSDEEEDSGDSSSADDDSKAGDSLDNDADVDVHDDRRNNNASSGGQSASHSMQWAVRSRDVTSRPLTSNNNNNNNTSGTSGIVYIDPSILRRSVNSNISTNQDNNTTILTTASQLARSFAVVVRMISELLSSLNGLKCIKTSETTHLQTHVYERLNNVWRWLVSVMDSTEAQLRFGSALTGPTSGLMSLVQQKNNKNNTTNNNNITSNLSSNINTNTNSTANSSTNNTSTSAPSSSRGADILQPHQLQSLMFNRPSLKNTTLPDGNSARRDFFNYALSLMRAHSSEHHDALPCTDVASLKHIAYIVDSFVYFMRETEKDEVEEEDVELAYYDSLANERIDEEKGGKKHAFFQRSESTILMGCTPPNPFSTPLHEALPLAEQPHLLQPQSRKEDLFGIPRQLINLPTHVSSTPLDHPPIHLSLTHHTTPLKPPKAPPAHHSTSSVIVSHHTGFMPTTSEHPQASSRNIHLPPTTTPSQASVIVHSGNPIYPQQPSHFYDNNHLFFPQAITPSGDHQDMGLDLTNPSKNTNVSPPLSSIINPPTFFSDISKDSSKRPSSSSSSLANDVASNVDNVSNTVIVETSATVIHRPQPTSVGTYLGRWRSCMELFGRVFSEDVGMEPNSAISEFGGFTVKEGRFRREMERMRNSQQKDLSLDVERDRSKLLVQSFKQLNSHYNRRNQSSHPLAVHRVKVSFKDEPGEGSGVARSFYTAFCQAVLSSEPLPYLESILSGADLLHRLKSREKERRRTTCLKTAKSQLCVEAPSFYPNLPQKPPVTSNNSNLYEAPSDELSISADKKLVGEKIFNKVQAIHPSMASKITGMLLELGYMDLTSILNKDDAFNLKVNEALELLMNSTTRVDTGGNQKDLKRLSCMQEDADVEDTTPLFWQPGKKGYYSPRPGRHTHERLNAFRNVGRIIGLCLLQNEICPIHLSRHVLKFLLGRPIKWHDFAFFDPVSYESLRLLLLDAEGKDGVSSLQAMDLTFDMRLSADEGGDHIEMINNGNNTPVTTSNVHDYARHYATIKMLHLIKRPLRNLQLGIFDVIPQSSFEGLTAEDLRLLLNGVGDINTQTLISYTSFNDETGDREGGDKVKRFKKWFWATIEKMNPHEKQDLVYFWMSSPALPASEEGFQPMPSVTLRPADDNHLPTANTCISRLYIPLYSTKNILRQKLLLAIKTKSFGFV